MTYLKCFINDKKIQQLKCTKSRSNKNHELNRLLIATINEMRKFPEH